MLHAIQQQQQRWRRSAGAAGFSPDEVDGLVLWLKADAITGLNDGEAVATWEDSSDANHDATQVTSTKQPTYETGIFNGQPAVRFVTDDFLIVADHDDFSFGNGTVDVPFAIFLVYQVRNLASAGDFMFIAKRNDAVAAEWAIGEFTAGQTNVTLADGSIAVRAGRLDTAAISNSTTYIQSNLYDATEAASGVQIWRNGVQVDDSDDVNGSYVAMENTAVDVTIGGFGTAPTAPLDGDIAEILVYKLSAPMDTTDREAIEDYLATKYGVTLP